MRGAHLLRRAFGFGILGIVLWGCGCSSSSSSAGQVNAQFVVPGVSLQSGAVRGAAGDIAHNTTSELTSLQYFILRIEICESLTVTGTAYSNQSGCIKIYEKAEGEHAYDTYKIAQAEADTSDAWVDIMSTSSIATMASNKKEFTAGTYNYGIIEIRKPIKINAKVVVPNGTVTLKTCTGGTVSSTGSDTSVFETTTVSNMTNCNQGLITIGSNGGGQWFKFQDPVTLDKSKGYTLDLAFNPEALLAGGVEAAGGWGSEASYKDGTYVMIPPPISVSPILRESSQKTVREQYEISGISGANGKIVLDLYFAGSKTAVGTGTIVGAGTRFVNNSSSTVFMKMYNPYSVTTASDGKITVNDYAGNPIVSGLARSTTETTGGTSSVNVSQSVIYGGATIGSSTVSATATFKGVTEFTP